MAKTPCTSRKILVTIIFLGPIVAAIGAWAVNRTKAFEMRLEPAGDGAMVQFAMPFDGLVSPKFPVDLTVDRSQTIELRSAELPVEGGAVEFHDPTWMPGRFTLRIGSRRFDVMEIVIVADGKEFDWQKGK